MPSPTLQPLAIHYGLRLDASDAFIQGYVDGMRLDQRGQGVACGRGWIPRSKKCSRDKASQTSKEAKAKTVEKAKARGKLKSEVKAAKGGKPMTKKKKEPAPIPDSFGRKIQRLQQMAERYPDKPDRVESAKNELMRFADRGEQEIKAGKWRGKDADLIRNGIEAARAEIKKY